MPQALYTPPFFYQFDPTTPWTISLTPVCVPDFQCWNRYYTIINGQHYSYSFSPFGIRSPLTPDNPISDVIWTPPPAPPIQTTPIVPPPSTLDPSTPPSLITPEPSSFILLTVAILTFALTYRIRSFFRRKRSK